jgi:hypothetical protein
LGQIGWAVYSLLFGVVGFLASIFMIAGRYYVFVLGYVIAGLLAGLVVSGLVFASLSELAGPEAIGEVIGTFLITAVISLVIYLVIIWYLRRPHVKAFFGKVPPLPAPPPAGIPPTPPSPQAQISLCPTCGAQLQYVPQYQRYWCPRRFWLCPHQFSAKWFRRSLRLGLTPLSFCRVWDGCFSEPSRLLSSSSS